MVCRVCFLGMFGLNARFLYAGPPAAGGTKDQNASGNLSEHLACIETRLCLIADPKQSRKELLLLGGMQLLGLGGPWRPLEALGPLEAEAGGHCNPPSPGFCSDLALRKSIPRVAGTFITTLNLKPGPETLNTKFIPMP